MKKLDIVKEKKKNAKRLQRLLSNQKSGLTSLVQKKLEEKFANASARVSERVNINDDEVANISGNVNESPVVTCDIQLNIDQPNGFEELSCTPNEIVAFSQSEAISDLSMTEARVDRTWVVESVECVGIRAGNVTEVSQNFISYDSDPDLEKINKNLRSCNVIRSTKKNRVDTDSDENCDHEMLTKNKNSDSELHLDKTYSQVEIQDNAEFTEFVDAAKVKKSDIFKSHDMKDTFQNVRDMIRELMLYQFQIFCTLTFGSARLNERKGSIIIYFGCKHPNHEIQYKGCLLILEKIIEIEITSTKCDEYVHEKPKIYSELRGVERNKAKNEVRYQTPYMYYLQESDKINEDYAKKGHLQTLRSEGVYQKIKSEDNCKNNEPLKNQEVADLLKLKTFDENDAKHRYLQCVDIPLTIQMFSVSQIYMLDNLKSRGQVTLNLHMFVNLVTDPCYINQVDDTVYFALVVDSEKVKNIPIAELIATTDTIDLRSFFRIYKSFVQNNINKWPLFDFILTDWDLFLINDMSKEWNELNLPKYLDELYNLLIEGKRYKKKLCIIKACKKDFIENILSNLNQHFNLSTDLEVFILNFISSLSSCKFIKQVDTLFKLCMTVLLTPNSNLVNDTINNINELFTTDSKEQNFATVTKVLKSKTSDLNIESTLFYERYNNSFVRIKSSIEPDITNNPLYSIEIANYLVTNVMPFIPICSEIIHKLAPQVETKTTKNDLNYLNVLQTDILQTRSQVKIIDLIKKSEAYMKEKIESRKLDRTIKENKVEKDTNYPEDPLNRNVVDVWMRKRHRKRKKSNKLKDLSDKKVDSLSVSKKINLDIVMKPPDGIVSLDGKISDPNKTLQTKLNDTFDSHTSENVGNLVAKNNLITNSMLNSNKEPKNITSELNDEIDLAGRLLSINDVIRYATDSSSNSDRSTHEEAYPNGLFDDVEYYQQNKAFCIAVFQTKYHDAIVSSLKFKLTSGDYRRLKNGWLSNCLIDYYIISILEQTSKDVVYIPLCFTSHILKSSPNYKIIRKNWNDMYNEMYKVLPNDNFKGKFLFPYLWKKHFMLIVADLEDSTLMFLDPMLKTSNEETRAIGLLKFFLQNHSEGTNLEILQKVNWQIKKAPDNRPYQSDGINCGIYCIHYLECFLEKKSFDMNFDPTKKRRELEKCLLSSAPNMKPFCLYCAMDDEFVNMPVIMFVMCRKCRRFVHLKCANRRHKLQLKPEEWEKEDVKFVCLVCSISVRSWMK